MALVSLCAVTLAMAGVTSLPYVAESQVRISKLLLQSMRARWRGAEYIGEAGMIRQPRSNDCGATCLKMILGAHGIDRDLMDLEREVGTNADGASLRNLRLAAERAGLSARSWKLTGADLTHAPLPAIAFVSGDHFVVVRRLLSPTSLEVDDPALGRLHWPLQSFCSSWRGETLLFDSSWRPDTHRIQGLAGNRQEVSKKEKS